ncbi:hypothetical protein BFJ65_g9951 [Fusarium oxysporum f. sp. cepae]|uniref:Uncharacterized protein n=1 Tax=Fusarium oxysporum f. sp. cepae TaxID=396571 RepID=A0A3L6NG08_FUSOX|nr:hypothetical protein BFJ65_g9951 [Fusarium oxysporum f. sp. cepae]
MSMSLTDVRLNTFSSQYVNCPGIASSDPPLTSPDSDFGSFSGSTPRLPVFHPYVRPRPLSPPLLTVLGHQILRHAVPLVSIALWFKTMISLSRVADLLQRKQYLHRLLPDIMEPLVMQAACPSESLKALYLSIKEGLADPRDMKIRPYKPEDLTAKEGQPDAADIIFNHPGYSDFSSHHIKLIAIALLSARESSFDHSDHIASSDNRHRDGAAVMLLAVAIRSRIGSLTVEAQWMIQAWYLQGSAKEWPLKWVAGRRLGPAEEQVRLSSWVMCS